MYTYHQASGVIDHDGTIVGVGYSGAPAGKNQPDKQNIPNVGPIPRGLYTIGDPHTDPEKGPLVMPLEPDPSNCMEGRSGFLIHGDSLAHPGCASEGCIILPHDVRERIAASADNQLTVVS